MLVARDFKAGSNLSTLNKPIKLIKNVVRQTLND